MHQVHSLLAQPAHPGAHRAPRRPHAWPCRGRCGHGPRPCRRRRAPCRKPPVVVSWAQGFRVVAWPPDRVATQLPTPALAPCHNTPRCIATQTPHSLALVTKHHVYCNTPCVLQYTLPQASFSCNTILSSLLSHNTISVLQYIYPLANLHASYCNIMNLLHTKTTLSQYNACIVTQYPC